MPKRDSKNPGKWDPEGLEVFLVNARGRRELRAAPASWARRPCHVPTPEPCPLLPSPRRGTWGSEGAAGALGRMRLSQDPKQPKSRGFAHCQPSDHPAPRLSGGNIPKQVGSQGKRSEPEGNSPPVFPDAGKKKKKKQCPQIVARRRAPLSLGTRQEMRNDEGKGTGSEVPLGHVALEGSRCRLR